MQSNTTVKVGIEMRVMAGAMTGIGNYSFHILDALIRRNAKLQFSAFDLYSWKTIDADALERIADVQTQLHTSSDRLPTLKSRAKKLVLDRLKNSETALSVYRGLFSGTVRRQSFDLFHAFNFMPFADPGVTTLPVVYDLSFVRYPEAHPQNRLQRLKGLPALLSRAPLIQTISEFSRQEISSVYSIPADRIFVAPPAASAVFQPLGLDRTRRDLVQTPLTPGAYLLAVGTLEPRKNLRTLITAYAQIPKSERTSCPLAIVGHAGWGALQLPRETEALVSEGSLIFLGGVSNALLRSLYEGAIALLFPSIYEGFGMPVVEAMACGTRVAHSSGTSMDEISGDLAIRVPALDVDAWATTIRRVIAEARDADAASTTDRIARAATFNWDRGAAYVERAYDTLLRK